jgi:DNA-binding beta-propeller fold protein YncE
VEPVDAAFDREGGMFLLDGRRKCIWLVERGGKVREAVSRDRFTEAAVKAPRAVALSGDRIYLLDTASPWVKVFDPADRFIMALKGDVEMRDPVDIAVDSRGMVYVADRKATCFHIYGSDGSYMNPRGTRGKESGDFLSPVAVAVSPEGRLLVLDEKRADIQVFDPDFRFLDRFVMREGRNAPVDLALTADGRSIFVLEGPDPAVAEYDSRGNPRAHSRDRAGLFPGLPGRASRIAVDGLGRVHVLPGGTTGVHRYTASGEGLGTFGVERPGDPMRVAVDDAGNFAILDASPPHVRLYDSDGWRLNRIGKPEERDRPFRKPHALAVTRRGLVAATLSHITRGAFDPMVDAPSVNVFQPNGTRTRSAGTYGRDTNQILRATDLDVDARGNVYVVDAGQRRISVFSATERRGGTAPDLTWKIPTEGKTAQDMAAPALIAVDAETADYYLYDAKLRQIKKFNRDKFFLGVVDGESVGFQSVERMRVDNLGLLWILDARKGEVSRVDFRQAVASVKARIPTAAIRGGVRDLGVDATGRVYILAGDDTVHVYR